MEPRTSRTREQGDVFATREEVETRKHVPAPNRSRDMEHPFHHNANRTVATKSHKKSKSLLRLLQDLILFVGLSVWLGAQALHSHRATSFFFSQLSTSPSALLSRRSIASFDGHQEQDLSSEDSYYNLTRQELRTQQLWKNALERQEQMAPLRSISLVLSSFFVPSDSHRSASDFASSPFVVSDQNYFSACLIVKDDNHWLTEWLAYHYHVMPLRRLIVVQDPSSHTSPHALLDRWKDRIHLEIWEDKDFLPHWVLHKSVNRTRQTQTRLLDNSSSTPGVGNHSLFSRTTSTASGSGGLWLHLNRQKHFYGQCLRHLQQKHQATWVMLTDTDEFVRVHPVVYPLPRSIRSQSGYVLQFLEEQLTAATMVAPHLRHDNQTNDTSLCLLAPRIQVSSVERNESSKNDNDVSPHASVSTSNFLTFRWLYHNGQEMPAGKNIVKLNPLDKNLPKAAHSVHHILDPCPKNTPGESSLTLSTTTTTTTHSHQHQPPPPLLQIQHYLGTLEQFTFRDDPRDAVDHRPLRWHSRGQFPPAILRDEGMTAWLDGFVQLEGLATAEALLKDAGRVELHTPRRQQARANQAHLQEAYNQTLVQEHLERLKQTYDAVEPFSACLVTMDDNHWLIEWLAYHYHVLPLKRLIHVQDPHSRTDARPILDRWNGRIDISHWNDTFFIPKHIRTKYQKGNITNAGLHRYRQKFFYSACLKELKRQNATWVLLIDDDEFVRPNTLQETKNAKVPTVSKPGCISRFLAAQLRARRVVNGDLNDTLSCLYVPRLQMAAKEDDLKENPVTTPRTASVSAALPKGWNPKAFLTLRWLYHNGKEITVGTHNLDGKNLIDVSKLGASSALSDIIPKQIKNVHHVLPQHCPASDGGHRIAHRDSWLILGHYLGTLEQYTFREDPRNVDIPGRPKRDVRQWKRLGQPALIRDDVVTTWLAGFVEAVGETEARRLLAHVGETEPNGDTTTARVTPTNDPTLSFVSSWKSILGWS